ncbi:MAG TPA: sensor domain-containing diguanylate cyclase [Gemmatimonadales bacterium]
MTNGAPLAPLGRPRVHLAGDAAARPAALERALTRAGYQVTEGAGHPALVPPDAVLITLPDARDGRLPGLLQTGGVEPPRIVLLAAQDPDAPAIALALGADDALAAPVHLSELCARLAARIRDRQAPRRTPYEMEVRETLQDLVAEARTMLQPDEIVVALVRRLARAFSLAQCALVVTAPGDAQGRVLADVDARTTETSRIDLTEHPEITEAIRTRRPVATPSPGRGNGHGSSPSIALPVLREDGVPAVLLLRRRDAHPALSPAQLELASSLAQVAAQALDGGLVSPSGSRGESAVANGLDRRLQEEFERARRYSLSFSLVLLDVQPGNGGNGGIPQDTHEPFRREVGARLRRELRLPDYVVRYGGEEFAIVLPETAAEGAHRSVTRVQERLAALPLESGVRPVFSAGIASYPHPAVTQADDLFALVEAALARGKLQSGERIGHAE